MKLYKKDGLLNRILYMITYVFFMKKLITVMIFLASSSSEESSHSESSSVTYTFR